MSKYLVLIWHAYEGKSSQEFKTVRETREHIVDRLTAGVDIDDFEVFRVSSEIDARTLIGAKPKK